MATFNLHRFTNVEALKRIDPSRLLLILRKDGNYFRKRGLQLPPAGKAGELNYERLIQILSDPEGSLPEKLADAFYLIHELSTEAGMDRLLREVRFTSIEVPLAEVTPADLATLVYLENPELLERVCRLREAQARRSFVYFIGEEPRTLEHVREQDFKALESDLQNYFIAKRRGLGCKIFSLTQAGERWFHVRHGDLYRREGSLEKGRPSSVLYRPERFDLVIYNPTKGELRVNAARKWERHLYRREFGRHLFGDADYFPESGKYTLEPLRQDGRDSLVCSDVEGIDQVTLKEVELDLEEYMQVTEILKTNNDLFLQLEAKPHDFEAARRIKRAKFEVRFSNSNRSRMVQVDDGNRAQYARDPDSAVVELWLDRRGFTSPELYDVSQAA